ncbi:MAG: dihydroxyacetone kinase subunit DhaK [Dethiobacteria bacterium]|jgi:dihydroxyacetone kinase-like protein
MKKIINDPGTVVSEMLKGIAIAHPDLAYAPEGQVIYRKKMSPNKVGIVSGGGSGHEPAHAGYVGPGMLDAAVSGNVFAAPSPDKVLLAIEKADAGKGVLLVIKNYSGDIMNFQMAQELASDLGIETASVIVKDDVAVPDSTYSTGRRGISGTVFVHKIAGAKAESGANLSEVQAAAQKAIDNVRSFGVSLTACTLPGVGKAGFVLEDDKMEIGMGIHGEPGITRVPLQPAADIANIMVEKVCADLDYTGHRTAVIVNGLGSTPLMELYILTGEVDKLLRERGIEPVKYMVGNFMTSLDMAGASLSMLRLDDELEALLCAPCHTPTLKEGVFFGTCNDK